MDKIIEIYKNIPPELSAILALIASISAIVGLFIVLREKFYASRISAKFTMSPYSPIPFEKFVDVKNKTERSDFLENYLSENLFFQIKLANNGNCKVSDVELTLPCEARIQVLASDRFDVYERTNRVKIGDLSIDDYLEISGWLDSADIVPPYIDDPDYKFYCLFTTPYFFFSSFKLIHDKGRIKLRKHGLISRFGGRLAIFMYAHSGVVEFMVMWLMIFACFAGIGLSEVFSRFFSEFGHLFGAST